MNDLWLYNGILKPPFYIKPTQSQISVWDFSRPPKIQKDYRKVEILTSTAKVLECTESLKICETASPPTWYFPKNELRMDLVRVDGKSSFCEWKGVASYYAIDGRIVAWSYHSPTEYFSQIKDMISFYASKVDCYVDGEKVIPQKSDFYGGWVTSEVIGPFKGDPGVFDPPK